MPEKMTRGPDRFGLSWPEIEARSGALLTGTTTSAVTQSWGCGHAVHSANGDALYASCPYCHVAGQIIKERRDG